MSLLDLTIDDVLTTTRSVRKRLDLERPVSRDTVVECLRLAFQAPNGSNQQLWHWVLIDDPDLKASVADVYRAAMADYISRPRDNEPPAPEPTPEAAAKQQRMAASVFHLREHLHEVPVLVVPGITGRMDGTSIFEQASLWGSVIPAIWSFMLALRSRGMGSAWTTIHLHREKEMAELLGIPYDTVTQAGLFPVAYTLGTEFKAADRSASEATMHWNGW